MIIGFYHVWKNKLVSLSMVKTHSNLFIKTLKKESKCPDIINILTWIGKIVLFKVNSKSVPCPKLLNKLNSKLLEVFSLNNLLTNKKLKTNLKIKIFDCLVLKHDIFNFIKNIQYQSIILVNTKSYFLCILFKRKFKFSIKIIFKSF